MKGDNSLKMISFKEIINLRPYEARGSMESAIQTVCQKSRNIHMWLKKSLENIIAKMETHFA